MGVPSLAEVQSTFRFFPMCLHQFAAAARRLGLHKAVYDVAAVTLEIAFKEFLVNESGQHYSNKKLHDIFSARHAVHAEVKKHMPLTAALWAKIDYYYGQRCKLVHDRATGTVPEDEIWDYREVVEKVLAALYKLKFSR